MGMPNLSPISEQEDLHERTLGYHKLIFVS